jgi:hypothetical protein
MLFRFHRCRSRHGDLAKCNVMRGSGWGAAGGDLAVGRRGLVGRRPRAHRKAAEHGAWGAAALSFQKKRHRIY